MATQDGIIAELAGRQGLARAPLFRVGEVACPGRHEVLLDGAFGSFSVSVGEAVSPLEASSWAWSSHLPHHVVIVGDDVHVLRWDRPLLVERFELRQVMERSAAFYDYLRDDRTEDGRTIVAHSLDLFRRVRNLILQVGLDDAASTGAYLGMLGAIASGREPRGAGFAEVARDFALPPGAADLLSALPGGPVEKLAREFGDIAFGDARVKARPVLSLRHASGAIFQEAHRQLLDGPPLDFFDHVGSARAARSVGSVVHFTPPPLARSLAEQALSTLDGLSTRKRLVVADFACGSGAFLVEALRALERVGYGGHVTLVGRDVSGSAVDMARFVLNMAASEWPGRDRSAIDLAVADTLRSVRLPEADVVVMNPPFVQWANMSGEERALLAAALGEDTAGRPDLSMAFAVRAVEALAPGGSMAILLPASALESKAASGWRRRISDGRLVSLNAVFDDHRIFAGARVRLGALVLGGASTGERVELRAGREPDALGDALRALRIGPGSGDGGIPGAFTLRTVPRAGAESAWASRERLRPLTGRAISAGATTVGALFDVQQGIRTGENKAFVLDDGRLAALPTSERRFFRPAVDSDGIEAGRVVKLLHVFYPYDDAGFTIKDEAALVDAVPEFLQRYLKRWQEKLSQRRSRSRSWWGLSERRRGLEDGRPFLVSKYFGKPGAFVLRTDPATVVLQGYGWIPKSGLRHVEPTSDVAAAYLALVNSVTFFSLVAEHAPPTGGGQLNLGSQYVKGVPMVDLTAADEGRADAVRSLAAYARERYLASGFGGGISSEQVERIARRLFGLEAATGVREHAETFPMPAWMMPLVDAGLAGTDKNHRFDVMLRIQDLAKEGTYAEIETALTRAPVRDLADTSLMTLVRGTYRFRSRLASWENFRDRVAAEYGDRGMPVAELMFGLYE